MEAALQTKESVSQQEQSDELAKFINALPHLKPSHTAWALSDGKRLLQEGFDIQDLKDKYQFYNHAEEMVGDIVANVPADKRLAVQKIVEEMLNTPSHGDRESIKLPQLNRIKDVCRQYSENKSLLKFTLIRYEGEWEKKVFKVLSVKEQEAFKTHYEKVFTPEFWGTINTMHPERFPNLSSTFIYFSPVDMLGNMDMKQLKSTSPKILKAVQSDIQEITDIYFSPKEKKEALDQIGKISLEKPADMLKFLITLKNKQEQKSEKSTKEFSNINKLVTGRHISQAHKLLEKFENNYGTKTLQHMGLASQVKQIRYKKAELEKLTNLLQTTADPNKRSVLIKKMQMIDDDSFSVYGNESNKINQQKKITKIKADISHKRNLGTLGSLRSAKEDAKKLKALNAEQGQQELDSIERDIIKQNNQGSEDKDKNTEHLSEEKRKRIEFIDRSIEHAFKVKEACQSLGIPTSNAPDYWSPEGCKNRQQWLIDNGKWNTYDRFNRNDKNMPQKSGSSNFRFRWLDLRSGHNLTAGKAEQGIKYLNRYKESGYEVAALGAGFSVDWRSSSSPSYDPEQFISICNAEKARIMSEK